MGRMIERQKTLTTTIMEEATKTRDEMKAAMRDRARAAMPTQQVHTVGDYAERWIMRKARQIKPSTAHKRAPPINTCVC